MSDGWIALHRKIYESKDFNNQLEVAVFLYLVAMASHKPVQVVYRKKKLNLTRGQVAIAFKDLSKKFNITERKMRTIIKNLIISNNLNQTLTRNLSIYTIVKYSKYQDMPVKTDQTLTDRTTTNTNILYSINKIDKSLSNMSNKPKPILAKLKSLQSKIVEPIKIKNEWEIAKESLDAQDYEKWVLHKLNR